MGYGDVDRCGLGYVMKELVGGYDYGGDQGCVEACVASKESGSVNIVV